jgi:hypothetical protein
LVKQKEEKEKEKERNSKKRKFRRNSSPKKLKKAPKEGCKNLKILNTIFLSTFDVLRRYYVTCRLTQILMVSVNCFPIEIQEPP